MLPSNFSFFQGSMKRKNSVEKIFSCFNKILLVAQTFNALNMNCNHFVKSDVRRRTYPLQKQARHEKQTTTKISIDSLLWVSLAIL